ncbi:MAG: SAM-dependent methyltransferase [Betaproteobacteria bacterium HGW-Betaproteobacteria-14]|nr:MAG: SAM-dependent methyltransferase [Betaproteobacteria bacterium HGW-Betaproteobacteria-14]
MHSNWYERHILPWLIDFACGMKSVGKQRMKVIPQAHGRVLEIGIGTGLNLPFYDAGRVSELVGVEPSLRMHRLVLKRSRAARLPVEIVGITAERLPLADAAFDTVVSTYTLCTIPDPVAALREARRVLAPGGRLLFSEHGRAPDESVRRWQDRIQPLWGVFSGGCHLGRDIPAILREAGFDPQVEAMYIPGPRIASYHYWGVATAI